eukprot:3120666-Pleurochrysis_carterae.AAC.1
MSKLFQRKAPKCRLPKVPVAGCSPLRRPRSPSSGSLLRPISISSLTRSSLSSTSTGEPPLAAVLQSCSLRSAVPAGLWLRIWMGLRGTEVAGRGSRP